MSVGQWAQQRKTFIEANKVVNKHIWNDLHTHMTMDIMFLTHSHRLGRSVLPAEFLHIRGHGAIVMRGKWGSGVAGSAHTLVCWCRHVCRASRLEFVAVCVLGMGGGGTDKSV